jgi:tripartite-type tricarboxylate transporter receptor subunit TctC
MAQTGYPDRPIRLLVPAGAGGPTDVVARILQPQLTGILGQPVVIENKAGASGNIGTAMVADSKPDGYTILMTPSTSALTPALYGKALGYDPVNAFTGISYVASVPLIVVVPMDGAKTLADLIAALRKDPEKYSYASSGNGGMIHLAGYLLLERAGVKALHVPYRGSAPGMIDTIAGRHAFQIDTLGSSKGFIDGGKLRVLAVAADKRLPQLPNVPTVEEAAGFKFSLNTWYVAQAPAATPRPIVDKLNAAFNQALSSPDVVKRMGELAIEPMQSTPASAKKYFDDQMAFWDPIVKASGAKPE